MRMGRCLPLAFVLVILAALVIPGAAQAQTCFFVGPTPDGRIFGPYSLSSASNDISLSWTVEAGRSYSVEAMTQQGPSGAGALSPAININTGFCPTTDAGAGFTIRDTAGITPKNCTGCGYVRRSVVSTVNADFLEMRVHNNSASASNVVVSVTETTMLVVFRNE